MTEQNLCVFLDSVLLSNNVLNLQQIGMSHFTSFAILSYWNRYRFRWIWLNTWFTTL